MSRLAPIDYLPPEAYDISETDKAVIYKHEMYGRVSKRRAKKYLYIGGELDQEFYPTEAAKGRGYRQFNGAYGWQGCIFLHESLLKSRK